MIEPAEFLNPRIGRPWTESDNCWSFVAEMQAACFGRDLPRLAYPASVKARQRLFASHPERLRWREIAQPEHGAIALIHRREVGLAGEHAGVCLMIPDAHVAHCDAPQGVCLDALFVLRARGWEPKFFIPI